MATGVKTVYAMINGQKVVAQYHEDTLSWSIETAAPAESSWSQPDHVYRITLHAEDNAGNSVEMTSSDPTYGEQLKVRVLEKTAPAATIVSPTQGSVIGKNETDIILEIQDAGGSGLNMESVSFKLNGAPISSLEWSGGEGGKKTAMYHATALPDGSNSIELSVTDNDGNKSNVASTSFIVSTAAPNLTVATPTEGLITNSSTVTVTGNVAPGNGNVTIASLTVNDQSVPVSPSGGEYSYEHTLSEGANVITVKATDSAGNSTQVVRNVTLDTKIPVITDVVLESTTVDAGGIIRITFKVTDQ